MSTISTSSFNWKCFTTWKQSAYNTFWCLIGCSIGDFGTIAYFQMMNLNWNILVIMFIAIINGILTSIILETIILLRQLTITQAFKTALGMSLISMLSMEIVMNTVDVIITGEAYINFYVVPFMLSAGFLAAWPYNYWRLKKYSLACH